MLSDRVWRRNDSYDEPAREAFEPVLHVREIDREIQIYKSM